MKTTRTPNSYVSPGPLLLLVQNGSVTRTAIVKELQDAGFRVAVARGTSEAREMLDDLQFIESDVDGLVVDYRLPDGLGCRIIQDFQYDNPHVPTALVLDEDDIAMKLWTRARGISLLSKAQLWNELVPWLERLSPAA